MKWGINDTQHCTITDVWFLTHYFTTSNSCITITLTAVAKNFDTFLAEWSGLNTLLRNAQEKYNLTTAPILSEMDKKVWIYEHFMGDSRFSSGIESRINATVNNQNFNSTRKVA